MKSRMGLILSYSRGLNCLIVVLVNNYLPFFSLYTLPHTSIGMTSCIRFFSFDPYDHYAVCCVALIYIIQ